MDNTIDPTLDLPRGGLPSPTVEWYESRGKNGAIRSGSLRFLLQDPSNMYRVFKITIAQYDAVTERTMELILADHLNKEHFADQPQYMRNRGIKETLKADFPFLIDSSIPNQWAHDALQQWFSGIAGRMIRHPNEREDKLLRKTILKRMSIKAQKAARGDAGDGPGLGDLALKDLVLIRLHSVLEKQRLFEPRYVLSELFYRGINGNMNLETRITSDEDLREAALCLRTPGCYELALEIVNLTQEDFGIKTTPQASELELDHVAA